MSEHSNVRPSSLSAGASTGPAATELEDSAHLTEDDQRVVEEAVVWLNGAASRSGLGLAVEVRDYVIARFFGGSYEAFSDPSSVKPASFRALAQRSDLEVSHATLYALVRVGEQARSLPAAVAEALSMRQHRALLPLADPEAKAALAAEALAHGWSAADIADEVRAQRPLEEAKGRPVVPPVVKQARALKRLLKAPALPEAGEVLTPKQRGELEGAAAALESHAAALRAALAAASED